MAAFEKWQAAIVAMLEENEVDNIDEVYGVEDLLENLHVDSNSDSDGSDEDMRAAEDPPHRRSYVKNRFVHSLDSALDSANYEPLPQPPQKQKVHQCTLQKRRVDGDARTIHWTNISPTVFGRRPRSDIVHGDIGVWQEYKDAKSPRKVFELFASQPIIDVDEIVHWTNIRIEATRFQNPAFIANSKNAYLNTTTSDEEPSGSTNTNKTHSEKDKNEDVNMDKGMAYLSILSLIINRLLYNNILIVPMQAVQFLHHRMQI